MNLLPLPSLPMLQRSLLMPLPEGDNMEEYEKVRKRAMKSAPDQANRYFGEDAVPYSNDFSGLKWWAENGKRFPDMVPYANKHLSVPGATANVERLFSDMQYMLGDKRKRKMHEKTASKRMRLRRLHSKR